MLGAATTVSMDTSGAVSSSLVSRNFDQISIITSTNLYL